MASVSTLWLLVNCGYWLKAGLTRRRPQKWYWFRITLYVSSVEVTSTERAHALHINDAIVTVNTVHVALASTCDVSDLH